MVLTEIRNDLFAKFCIFNSGVCVSVCVCFVYRRFVSMQMDFLPLYLFFIFGYCDVGLIYFTLFFSDCCGDEIDVYFIWLLGNRDFWESWECLN